MSADPVLVALAVSNLVLAAAAVAFARRSVDARWGWGAAGVLVTLASVDVLLAMSSSAWSLGLPMLALDAGVLVAIAYLLQRARSLELQALSVRRELEWRRTERERALRDRCADLF